MIDHILNIAKIFIATLPILIVLCFVGGKNNLQKSSRYKQFSMPIISLVYCIIVLILKNKVSEWVFNFVKKLSENITKLSDADWMPDKIDSFLKNLASSVDKFLANHNVNLLVFFIFLTLVFVAFLLLKRIIISILNKAVKPDSGAAVSVSGLFYEYDEEYDMMYLKREYTQARGFFRVFCYTAVVVAYLLLITTAYLLYNKLFHTAFYPLFIIILCEIYFFLSGLTAQEYRNDVLGEDENALHTVNYTLIKKFLRTLFGDKLNAENTAFNTDLIYTVTNEEIFRQLSDGDSQEDVSFAAYYEALSKNGFRLDHNYLFSSYDLMHGKSILFNNPFYYDLIPYAFYPMNRCLLNHGKVLVVLGRHAIENDVEEWIKEGIGTVTNIPFLWNISVLNDDYQETDIGILTRSNILNIKVHDANEDFLNRVDYVVIIEPSKLISTAQIGLNMLVKKCMAYREREIVYCLCDKNCDGLVDAMSHILLKSITEVSATGKHKGINSYMGWDVDDEFLQHRMLPSISRYLGIGTELSFAALRNQVSKTTWYGGETFPVTDMRWIDGQYYFDLMRYAGLPTNQDEMDTRFVTNPNFWSAKAVKNNYITVEDESFNMFEAIRDFSTRATEQGFVNVISSDYLLKDYMADNADIFETDPKAIPCIVPDFVRSRRNTVFKLLLMMSVEPVSETLIVKEFALENIPVYSLREQLWFEIFSCFVDCASFSEISDDYKTAVARVSEQTLSLSGDEKLRIGINVIRSAERFNLHLGKVETVYSIDDENFIDTFVSDLKSASYVSEDEKGSFHYFGAELRGHVYQRYLPGQFFTFDGKYYRMDGMTADGDILVRRSADHINGRKYYRQIRHYSLQNCRVNTEIGSARDVSGIKVVHEFADVFVHTSGYLEMTGYGDYKTARTVRLDIEGVKPIDRRLPNKSFLRIELPDGDGKFNDNVRYSMTVLMNEVFRSLFAENQAFVVALTDDSFLDEEASHILTSSIETPEEELKNSIYIVEDSYLDIGLLDAVERNLDRIFDIISDYILWHYEKLDELLDPPKPPEPVPVDIPPAPEPKKGFFRRLIDKLFRRKKKEEPGDGTIDEGDGKTGDGDGKTGDGEQDRRPKDKGDDQTESKEKGEENPEGENEKGKGRIARFFGRLFGKLFKRKKKKGDSDDEPVDEPTGGEVEPEDGGEEPFDDPTGGEVEPEDGEEEPFDDPTRGEIEPEDGGEEPFDDPTGGEIEPEDGGEEPFDNQNEIDKPDFTDDFGFYGPAEDNGFAGSDEFEFSAGQSADGSEGSSDADPDDDDLTPPVDASSDDVPSQEEMTEETPKDESLMPPPDEGEDLETVGEEEYKEGSANKTERRPYNERYFTHFGFEVDPAQIDLGGVLDYLSLLRPGKNSLTQARDNRMLSEYLESEAKKDRRDSCYCDFCGAEILRVEYETLADGRDRCMKCSRTAIKTGEEFKVIFDHVKHDLESYFNISFRTGVRVEMVNSRVLHRRLGKSFVPTGNHDGRVLGVAIRKGNQFTLLVENGSPRMASMLTIAHELTHIWQYSNWNEKNLRKMYGKDMLLEIYEGMAKWVEVQYAWLLNEAGTAKRMELETLTRPDEYGRGFIRYRANYPFVKVVGSVSSSPFMNVSEPLSREFCVPLDTMFILPPELPQPIEGKTKRGRGDWRGSDRDSWKKAVKGGKTRDPDHFRRYSFELLNENEKAIYSRMEEALDAFEADVSGLEVFGIQKDDFLRIVKYLIMDRPDAFWYSATACSYDQATEIVNSAHIYFCLDPQQVEERKREIEENLGDFLVNINDSISDYELVLRIYENIIKQIDYDSIGLEKQEREREADPDSAIHEPDDLRSIYGVFVNRKAVCAGYAKATQYLLNMFGIECLYYSNDVHAWNIVNLEGDYYHLDTTWGDATNTKPEKNVSEEISYDCFCITTEDVLRLSEHQLIEGFPAPLCTATACNYYRRMGAFFESFDYEAVRDLATSLVANGSSVVSFRCANKDVFDQTEAALIKEHGFREILQFINLKTKVRADMTYSYVLKPETLSMRFIIKLI